MTPRKPPKHRDAGQFAGFDLEQRAGEDRNGVVYRARDLQLGRAVALRIVAPDIARDPIRRARLNRESTALAGLDHPNVLPIYEVGEDDGTLFIASRWVDGSRLSALVREGPLALKRAVRIVNQVAWALQAAHEMGIVHRNVKPASVLVTPADQVYLTDFGHVRRSDELMELTLHDRLPEEADYVAPEYVAGETVDASADIYGLGCVLYEALTGEVAFPQAGPAAKPYAHRFADPPSARRRRPDVPEALDAVIARAMAKDPEARQQSAGEFAIEAAGALDMSAPPWAAVTPRATPPAGNGGPRRPEPVARETAPAPQAEETPPAADVEYLEPVFYSVRRRRRRRLLSTVALLLLVAVAAVLLLTGGKHPPRSAMQPPAAAASVGFASHQPSASRPL